MTYNILPIFLLASMLIIMLMSIMLPFGAKITGKKVGAIRLNFRERLLLQRINIYAIGFVLLLSARFLGTFSSARRNDAPVYACRLHIHYRRCGPE
jgi:hypothetical protein